VWKTTLLTHRKIAHGRSEERLANYHRAPNGVKKTKQKQKKALKFYKNNFCLILP